MSNENRVELIMKITIIKIQAKSLKMLENSMNIIQVINDKINQNKMKNGDKIENNFGNLNQNNSNKKIMIINRITITKKQKDLMSITENDQGIVTTSKVLFLNSLEKHMNEKQKE